MRRVGRLAGRYRRIERARPRPVWLDRTIAASRIAGPVLLIAGLIFTSQVTGFSSRVADDLKDRFLNLAADQGFRVEEIQLTGLERTNPNILRSILARYTGSIILAVDKANLKQEIESLPWVREARVRILLPSRLSINLSEHDPFAWWQQDDRLVMVSAMGEPIGVSEALTQKYRLPIIAGDGAPEAAFGLFEILAQQPQLHDRITAAHLVSGRRWDVYLDGHTEIKLPSSDITEAWGRLARRDARDNLLGRAVSTIDLRNPDWIILELEDAILSEDLRGRA